MPVATERARTPRPAKSRSDALHVLYWMTAYRRTRMNIAPQHAVSWAKDLDQPLLVLEALRGDHPWAIRGWGSKRPVDGTIRYTSSRNPKRKVKVAEYVQRCSRGGGTP